MAVNSGQGWGFGLIWWLWLAATVSICSTKGRKEPALMLVLWKQQSVKCLVLLLSLVGKLCLLKILTNIKFITSKARSMQCVKRLSHQIPSFGGLSPVKKRWREVHRKEAWCLQDKTSTWKKHICSSFVSTSSKFYSLGFQSLLLNVNPFYFACLSYLVSMSHPLLRASDRAIYMSLAILPTTESIGVVTA